MNFDVVTPAVTVYAGVSPSLGSGVAKARAVRIAVAISLTPIAGVSIVLGRIGLSRGVLTSSYASSSSLKSLPFSQILYLPGDAAVANM